MQKYLSTFYHICDSAPVSFLAKENVPLIHQPWKAPGDIHSASLAFAGSQMQNRFFLHCGFHIVCVKAPTLGPRADLCSLWVNVIIILWLWRQQSLLVDCLLSLNRGLLHLSLLGSTKKPALAEPREVLFSNSTHCFLRASICCQGRSLYFKGDRSTSPYCLSAGWFLPLFRNPVSCLHPRREYAKKFENETLSSSCQITQAENKAVSPRTCALSSACLQHLNNSDLHTCSLPATGRGLAGAQPEEVVSPCRPSPRPLPTSPCHPRLTMGLGRTIIKTTNKMIMINFLL